MSSRSSCYRRNVLKGALLAGGVLALDAEAPAHAAGERVRVLNSAGVVSNVMETMIKNLGYAKQFGLDVQFQNLADGNTIIGGLLGGDGDACSWSGFPQVLPAIEQGGRIKIIGGSLILPALALVSANPQVRRLKDLEGKTIAAGSVGSILYMGVIAAMRKAHVDHTKVKFIKIGSSQNTLLAVSTGTVDAGLAEFEVQGQLKKFGIHNVDGGVMWDELPDFTWQAAYASEQAIASKRDLLVRLLAMNAQLFRFLQSPVSWDECAKAFQAQAGVNFDAAACKAFWNFFQTRKPLAVDLVLSKRRFDYVQQLNLSLGVQKTELPYEQIADMSLAHDALKLIG